MITIIDVRESFWYCSDGKLLQFLHISSFYFTGEQPGSSDKKVPCSCRVAPSITIPGIVDPAELSHTWTFWTGVPSPLHCGSVWR